MRKTPLRVYLKQMANAGFNGDRSKAKEWLKQRGIESCDTYMKIEKVNKKSSHNLSVKV